MTPRNVQDSRFSRVTESTSKPILLLSLLALSVFALFSLCQRPVAVSWPGFLPATSTLTQLRAVNGPFIASTPERTAPAVLDEVSAKAQIRNLPGRNAKPIRIDSSEVGHLTTSREAPTDSAGQYEVSSERFRETSRLIDPHGSLIGRESVIFTGHEAMNARQVLVPKTGYYQATIGASAHGYPLESFRIGDGRYHVIVVGAIHGGYEWNTALLAYRLVTHFSIIPETVPDEVSLNIIPIANPDGVFAVTGKTGPFLADDVFGDTAVGRPNGNGVDLNRIWGCGWLPVGRWRETEVAAGSRPLSEPETRVLREYLIQNEPEVVIWLHSAGGLVTSGGCDDVRHEASEIAAALYGESAGYPVGAFDAYCVTGDAADWLAQHKIASFTV